MCPHLKIQLLLVHQQSSPNLLYISTPPLRNPPGFVWINLLNLSSTHPCLIDNAAAAATVLLQDDSTGPGSAVAAQRALLSGRYRPIPSSVGAGARRIVQGLLVVDPAHRMDLEVLLVCFCFIS